MSLKGKIALVTGSTSGIGLGIAHALAAEGADIVFNGFGDAAVIKDLMTKTSEQYKVRCEYHGADISKPDQIRDMMRHVSTSLGGDVDILVNNAGIQYVANVEDFPDEKWDSIIAINLSSNFHAIKAVLPSMKKKNWGRIVNISSAHGLAASAQKSAYVAAKHGVVGLTKVVALETARTGITCNAICPGWVLTPLVQKQIDDRAKNEGKSVEAVRAELLGEKQPSGEFVTPEQIGGLTVFLCSDAAAQIRGSAYNIDGGWLAE